MSSRLGSIANNVRGGWEVYRANKAALNTLMRSFAARHASDPRGFVIIAPGWVRTDMGSPKAPLGVEDSIPGMSTRSPARWENPVCGFWTARAARFGGDPPLDGKPASAGDCTNSDAVRCPVERNSPGEVDEVQGGLYGPFGPPRETVLPTYSRVPSASRMKRATSARAIDEGTGPGPTRAV